MNCRGDEDIDAKRSRPSIGKPVMGHARKERVVLFGTDQRITSGPAAKRPHSKAEYMTAPERFADSQIPLAPRAPSIHDPTGQSPAPPSANSTASNFPETTGGTRQHRRALPITSPERETSSLLSFHGASRDAADEAVEEKVVRDCHRDARDQRRAHQFAPVEDVAANEVGRDPQGDGLFLR